MGSARLKSLRSTDPNDTYSGHWVELSQKSVEFDTYYKVVFSSER